MALQIMPILIAALTCACTPAVDLNAKAKDDPIKCMKANKSLIFIADSHAGEDPHGSDPHGGDPHNENHDGCLPANAQDHNRNPDPGPYGSDIPNSRVPYPGPAYP
jgi:hypothetical protein